MVVFHRSLPLERALPVAARLAMALTVGVLVSNCSSSSSGSKRIPKAEVVVSVKDQRMGIYSEGHLKKQFVVSTSKFGLGDRPGSNCTPLGKHEIIAKIGHGLPAGAVLKSRSWNGEVLKPNAPGRDPIVSRILWLRGMESSNRNAMNRFIYIHGTPEENRLGSPASYGCIRMGMKDVVEVFNELSIGAKVVVTKEHLPHGKAEEKKPEVKPEDVVPAPVAPPVPVAPLVAEAKKPGAGTTGGAVSAVVPVTSTAPHAATGAPASKGKKEVPVKAKGKNEGTKAESINSEPIANTKSKKAGPKVEKVTTSKRTLASVDSRGVQG